MGFEDLEASQPGGAPTKSLSGITLQRAIDMGEYDPDYLATFAEWHGLSRNMQWQMIHDALKNRRKLLNRNWAEIVNQPDFSKKPYLNVALRNIESQLKKLQVDEEKLQVEYSM